MRGAAMASPWEPCEGWGWLLILVESFLGCACACVGAPLFCVRSCSDNRNVSWKCSCPSSHSTQMFSIPRSVAYGLLHHNVIISIQHSLRSGTAYHVFTGVEPHMIVYLFIYLLVLPLLRTKVSLLLCTISFQGTFFLCPVSYLGTFI